MQTSGGCKEIRVANIEGACYDGALRMECRSCVSYVEKGRQELVKSRRIPRTRILTRRQFLNSSAATAAALLGPTIVPASVFGADAPSNRITFGFIGVGRMGSSDMREILGLKQAQIVAVCDVDSNRVKSAREGVETHYARQSSGGTYAGCKTFGDYRDLVPQADIDAVSIATPDHWHVLPAIAAAKAGKDIFLQKPLSLTIGEGRALSDTVTRYGRVFQVGSQQRSDARWRHACELVRNGRIGKLHTVKVGFGTDPGTSPTQPMPVPEGLDYDFWLGPTQWEAYTEKRVHPKTGYGRPGWLRIAA
ncbi:MAG: hypothetical protein GQ528_03220, partial [Woeseiaceae bacterium]|nr:hypothetical protein [Woeseiaceae bacterium]